LFFDFDAVWLRRGMISFFAKVSVFITLVVLLYPELSALDPQKSLHQYVRSLWVVKDGLPHNYIRSIVQTGDGYIWLATDEGLVRFDGVSFKIFNRTNLNIFETNKINSLHYDKDGTLWIGTDENGLFLYKNRSFIRFNVNQAPKGSCVKNIYEDDRGILNVVTEKGEYYFKDSVFKKIESEAADLYSRKIDKLGKKIKWKIPKKIKTIFSNKQVTSLLYDSKKSLWIGTKKDGLIRIVNGTIHRFTVRDGLASNVIGDIFEDRESNIWLGTENGLNMFYDGAFTTFTRKEGLSGNRVYAIYEDSKKSLWVGTRGGGLNLLSSAGPTVYTRRNGLASNVIGGVLEDSSGNMWIGTSKGLNLFKDGKFIKYSIKDGLKGNVVAAVFEDSEKNLWVGTDGEIFEDQELRVQDIVKQQEL